MAVVATGGGRRVGLPSNAAGELREQQDAANAANENRYQGILDLIRNTGAQSRRDVTRGVREEQGTNLQQMISQGLGNTTAVQAINNRSAERGQREISRINDQVAMNLAGVMERRTDQGPNSGAIAAYEGQAAQGNAQGGRSFSFMGGAPGGAGGFGGGGQQPQNNGGGGGGGGGGAAGPTSYTNPNGGRRSAPARSRPCGYIKNEGCTLPDGSTWMRGGGGGGSSGGGFTGGGSSRPTNPSTRVTVARRR